MPKGLLSVVLIIWGVGGGRDGWMKGLVGGLQGERAPGGSPALHKGQPDFPGVSVNEFASRS